MKDLESLASGGIFVALGGIYGVTTALTLPIGTTFNMGPGYFPLVLSGLLVLFGGAIVVRGFRRSAVLVFGPIPWRALAMISLAILCFAYFIRSLGLFPTSMLTSILTCLGDGRVGIAKAMALALILAVICTSIFSFGIGLPIPIFGPWLRGWI